MAQTAFRTIRGFLSSTEEQTESGAKMTLPEDFDIIVCGGGSAGCVVAGRLANLDHNLKVLLIEGGENNLNNPW
jgi:ribulose 1,5-bisphosphate synthetase/thiazole synthase